MCNLYSITTNQTPEMGPGFVEALPVGCQPVGVELRVEDAGLVPQLRHTTKMG